MDTLKSLALEFENCETEREECEIAVDIAERILSLIEQFEELPKFKIHHILEQEFEIQNV